VYVEYNYCIIINLKEWNFTDGDFVAIVKYYVVMYWMD